MNNNKQQIQETRIELKTSTSKTMFQTTWQVQRSHSKVRIRITHYWVFDYTLDKQAPTKTYNEAMII